MPTPETIARVHAHSARRLGTEERHFASDRTVIHIRPRDTANRFNVIATRRLGGGCVIIVHEHLHEAIARFEGEPADETFDEARLRGAYDGLKIELGTSAAQAYADASDLREPVSSGDLHVLESADVPALIALRDATPEAEWIEGGLDRATPPIITVLAGGAIAGAARAVAEGDVLRIGVLTHPAHRGRGHAQTAAYGVARYWTAVGAVMEWQARLGNIASLRTRDALGFVEMYRSIVLRVV